MPPSARDTATLAAPRRKPAPALPAAAPETRRKTVQLLLAFVTLVLVINALVGDRGLMETLRARQVHQDLAVSIDRLREENAQLRDEVRRLRSDPATIEALARQELGLIRPGELLFIIKDAKPAATSAAER